MNIKKTQAEILAESKDMTPVHGFVDVDVPIETLWQIFSRPNTWHRWNHCFLFVINRELVLGEQLICLFEPIRSGFLYKMPAIAKIIELKQRHKVTWEVTFIRGFYARHTYYMEDLGNGRTRFGFLGESNGLEFSFDEVVLDSPLCFCQELFLKRSASARTSVFSSMASSMTEHYHAKASASLYYL